MTLARLPSPQAVSLGLLALMASGPFLLPVHTQPLPDFWGEWWATLLGLLAVGLGIAGARSDLRLPRLLFLPGVLLLAMLGQLALGKLLVPQLGALAAAYLLWATLLLVLGRLLADEIGLERVVDVLAFAVLAGACLSVVVALLQWQGFALGLYPWVFPNPSGSITGNLAQPNHLAHYLALGAASALYLDARGRLPRTLLWPVLAALAWGSLLTGSRSAYLYPLLILFAFLWARRQSGPVGRRLPIDAAIAYCLLVPAAALAAYLIGWVLPSPSGRMPFAGAARLSAIASDPPTRMALARAGWDAFVAAPWLGQGMGNYAWASFSAAAASGGATRMPAEHAHNFVIQLLAEFGAPVAAVVIGLLWLWLRSFLGHAWTLAHAWCAAVLAVGVAHGMLEYPHWFAYFLGPTALLLGATDTVALRQAATSRFRLYVVVILAVGLLGLAHLAIDYRRLDAAANRPLATDSDRETAWRRSLAVVIGLQQESLLAPWATLALATMAEPSPGQAADLAALCRRGIRFSPERGLVTRCAMQMALAGDAEAGRQLVRDVLRAYPADAHGTVRDLQDGAKRYPELTPLWGLAREIAGGADQKREIGREP